MNIAKSLLISTLLLPAIATAHHAFRVIYDFSRTETIEGTVVRLELVNPHARLYVDVADENGEMAQWVVEGPGKLSLARRGWTDDMFHARESRQAPVEEKRRLSTVVIDNNGSLDETCRQVEAFWDSCISKQADHLRRQ